MAGFVLGLVVGCVTLGIIAAAVAGALSGTSGPSAGIAILVIAGACAAGTVLGLRRDPIPFVQGLLIGGAIASLLVGICGGFVMLG